MSIDLTEKQSEAWAYLASDAPLMAMLYGGAKGGGKIVANDGVVLTPFGFKRGDSLHVGDIINNPDGTCQKIIQIKPEVHLPLWRVTFDDGASTDVAEDHLWLAWKSNQTRKVGNSRTSGEDSAEIVETKTLKEWISKGYHPQIPVCKEQPFNVTSKHKKLDPYLLGLLIGDGCFTANNMAISCGKDDMSEYRKILGEEDLRYSDSAIYFKGALKKHIQNKLRSYGLLGKYSHEKFIPTQYKMASIADRYALVQGLMDTDGHKPKDKNGAYYYTTSKQLSDDMTFVLRSLGAVVSVFEKDGKYKDKDNKTVVCRKCYCLYIKHREPNKLVRLERKKYAIDCHNISRRVVAVSVCGEIRGRCITVSNPNGLYITNDFIVTHNSFFLCVWACSEAIRLADQFGITRTDNPIPVGFLGRKRGVDFTNTTLATWKRVIPHHHYEIKEQKKLIIVDGRVAIAYGGLDDEATINKFNSAEFAFAGIDQAEETDQSDVSVLFGALRLKVNGIQPTYRMMYTANPAECWLKGEFPITGATQQERVRRKEFAGMACDYVYVPALYTDNKHLPDNYAATLEAAFGYDEQLLTAYKIGDWSLARDSDTIVTRSMLEKLKGRTVLPTEEIIVAACDPSIGGDECVFYVLRNGEKIAEKITHETNTMVIASDFVKFCKDNDVKAEDAGIDTCGLGIGIGQRCHQIGFNCKFINSAEKSSDIRCHNVRDEVWLSVRDAVMRNELPPITDNSIIDQMCTFRFKTENGKFRCMPKNAVKSKIGQSPDRADAFAYGIYMTKHAKARKKRNEVVFSRSSQSYDWRAV